MSGTVTSQQYRAWYMLRERGPATAKTVSVWMRIGPEHASAVLRALHESKAVTRTCPATGKAGRQPSLWTAGAVMPVVRGNDRRNARIVAAYACGRRQRTIAAEYGLSQGTVSQIISAARA